MSHIYLLPKFLIVLEDFAIYLLDVSLLFFTISRVDLKATTLHANNIQQLLIKKRIALLSVCKSKQEQLGMHKS